MYTDYNILVDGDIYNNNGYTYPVTSSGFVSLYDGDTSTAAFVVPTGEVSSFCVEFGEAAHVDHVSLYASPLNVSDVSFSYGVDTDNINQISVVSSGTYAYGYVGAPLSYLYITVSGSVEYNINQLKIYPTAFQCSTLDYTDAESVGAPVGVEGGNVFVSTVFNGCSIDKIIGVVVSPYNEDGVSFSLAVGASGVFYAENEHGVHQPAHVPLSDISNPLSADTISSFYNDWDRFFSNRAYVSSEQEYLRLVVQYEGVDDGRKVSPWNEYTSSFYISNHSFTMDQSFTFSIDVAVLGASLENLKNDAEASWSSNKFMLGFTDSFLVSGDAPRHGELDTLYLDLPRRSIAAVWLGALKHEGAYNDLFVGALANDGNYSFYRGYTDFDDEKTNSGLGKYASVLSSVRLDYLSEQVYKEESYIDGSSSAPWRRLWVTYDHRTRKVDFYIDNVLLSEYSFSPTTLFDKTHLFFGFDGVGGFDVAMKNVLVYPDVVYGYTQAITSISTDCVLEGSYDSYLIDGRLSDTDYNYAWVGAATGKSSYSFFADLSSSYPIECMRVAKPSSSDSITVSGSTYSSARYSVKSVELEFNTGDVRYAFFDDPTNDGLGGWDVSYLTTISGTVEPVIGASSVSATFTGFYDRGVGENVFVIDQLFLCSVSGSETVVGQRVTSSGVPWDRGYGYNVIYGEDGVLRQAYTDVYDISTREDCYNLVYGVDYGANSVVFDASNYYDLYHYGESVFKRDITYNTQRHKGLSTVASAGYAYIWRRFDAEFAIKGVYFSFMSSPQTGSYFQGKPDKWKLQYLKRGGDPASDEDWIDIPPLLSPHGFSGEYYTFTSYLVAHNDGEYYTSYINSMDVTGDVEVPADLACYKNRFNSVSSLTSFNGVTSSCYIEFPSAYYTQGIRIVIADGYDDIYRNNKATGYMFTDFVSYNENPVSFYVSPVIDTETEFNTERIHISAETISGTASVTYRGSDTPPDYALGEKYNRWEGLGVPFAGLDSPYSGTFSSSVALVAYGDYIYFIDENTEKMVYYNTVTGKWSYGDYLPTETTGESIVPDTRTRNPAVLFGDTLVVATKSTDGSYINSGLYKYYISSNAYSYQGWEAYPYQRQPEAVNASFVGDGSRFGYFLAVDGTVTVFDITDGSLDTEGRSYMPLHGSSSRDYFVPAYYNGKLYVCGGSGCGRNFDIYDIDSDTWEAGPDMPIGIERAHAVYINGFIYVLAKHPASDFSAYLRYDLSTEEWEQLSALSYNNQTSYVAFNKGGFGSQPMLDTYVVSGDYIYGFSTAYGDFRRILAGQTVWSHGFMPSYNDTVWSSSSFTGTSVAEAGEYLPQGRYIQFTTVMEAYGGAPSSVRSVDIVTPQEVSIAAGKEEKIRVKTDVSTEYTVELWRTVVGDYNKPYVIYNKNENAKYGGPVQGSFSISTSVGGSYYYSTDFCLSGLYTGYASVGPVGDRYVTSTDIYSITSSDGVSWSLGSVVIPKGTLGAHDAVAVHSPSYLYVDGTHHIWYTGEDSFGVGRIIHAVSSDGMSWHGNTVVVDKASYIFNDFTDDMGATHPSVVYADGIYYMLYEAISNKYVSSIMFTQSVDGVRWAEFRNAVVPDNEAGGFGAPMLVYDCGVYRLWLIRRNGKYSEVWYGESSDPSDWTVSSVEGANYLGEIDYPEHTDIFVRLTRPVVSEGLLISADIKLYER